MVVLVIPDSENLGQFTIHKDYANLEEANKDHKLSHDKIRVYGLKDYVEVSLGAVMYGYLVNLNTFKKMGPGLREAIRDYKLNKLLCKS